MRKNKTLSDKIDNKASFVVEKVLELQEAKRRRQLEVSDYVDVIAENIKQYAGERFNYYPGNVAHTFTFEGRLVTYSVILTPVKKIGMQYNYEFIEEWEKDEFSRISLESLEKKLKLWLKKVAKYEGVE